MSIDPVTLCRQLLMCPSVTPLEGGALALLQGVLEHAGFTAERMVFSEDGTPDVDNLYARIGSEAPFLVFAGHTDVVPPGDDSAWTHGPFAGVIDGGTLYGRGAVDMKGGIACFVAATLGYLARHGGKPPKGSIGFLITGDEEGPSINGTEKLLQWAAMRGERFDHCLLGEPTNPDHFGDMIKIGRRGSLSATITVEGVQGHVAYPQRAANPIAPLLRILRALTEKPLDSGNAHFDASNLEVTSIDVGNAATNIIPARAEARFNIRFNDEHTLDSLKAWTSALVHAENNGPFKAGIAFSRGNSDSFITMPGPFVDLVAVTVEEATGRKPQLSTSGGTSDARFIKNYCPVVEFGLVGKTMHMVDERVPVADLKVLTEIYGRIIERYFAAF